MDFVQIDAGPHELGWRFSESLSPEVRAGIDDFMGVELYFSGFSPARSVRLPAFEIAASATLTVAELVGDIYALEVDSIAEVCDVCDAALLGRGLRLPTEDELEAAFGGQLFVWGDEVPHGVPFGRESSFVGHKRQTARGLLPLGDAYQLELTRSMFKVGDGGEAVCGDYPWPIPWFSFCPSFRLPSEAVEEALPETLDSTFIRPVRL